MSRKATVVVWGTPKGSGNCEEQLTSTNCRATDGRLLANFDLGQNNTNYYCSSLVTTNCPAKETKLQAKPVVCILQKLIFIKNSFNL